MFNALRAAALLAACCLPRGSPSDATSYMYGPWSGATSLDNCFTPIGHMNYDRDSDPWVQLDLAYQKPLPTGTFGTTADSTTLRLVLYGEAMGNCSSVVKETSSCAAKFNEADCYEGFSKEQCDLFAGGCTAEVRFKCPKAFRKYNERVFLALTDLSAPGLERELFTYKVSLPAGATFEGGPCTGRDVVVATVAAGADDRRSDKDWTLVLVAVGFLGTLLIGGHCALRVVREGDAGASREGGPNGHRFP